jgi:hypothetical protein
MERDEATLRQLRYLKIGLVLIMLLVVVGAGYRYLTDKPPVIFPTPIASEAYKPLPGCPVREYGSLDNVPTACLADRYHINHAMKYGLHGEYRHYVWYRIGDNAYWMSCEPGEDCTVFQTRRHFFVR